MIDARGIYRLARYSVIGAATFFLDLYIVYLLSERGVGYVTAVIVGYIIGVSLNYLGARPFAFAKTERPFREGYGYFIAAASASLAAILILTGILVSGFAFPLLPSRFIVGTIIGFVSYLFNLYVNFDVAGKH